MLLDSHRGQLQKAVATDVAYFLAGASISEVPGGVVAFQNEQRREAVCLFREPTSDRCDLSRSISTAIALCRENKVARQRLYFTSELSDSSRVLLATEGFQSKMEVAFVGVPDPQRLSLELSRIESENDWQDRIMMQELSVVSPDGHVRSSDELVALERGKANTLAMQSFFLVNDRQRIGFVSSYLYEGCLRVKNLVLLPEWRFRGFGGIALRSIYESLEQEQPLFLFGLKGSASQKAYRRAGLLEVGDYEEWSRIDGTGPAIC